METFEQCCGLGFAGPYWPLLAPGHPEKATDREGSAPPELKEFRWNALLLPMIGTKANCGQYRVVNCVS